MRNTLFVLLAVLALAACKKTPTDPVDDNPGGGIDSNAVRWTMPRSGSQYLMEIETTDSINSVSANRSSDVFKIIQSNISWMGRDSAFLYGWGTTARQYHVTFESNGDTGYETNGPEVIEIYPTGKIGRVNLPTKTENMGGGLTSVTTSYKENVGREKMTFDGKEYNTVKITSKTVKILAEAGQPTPLSTETTYQTWWYAPSLGFCAKVVRDLYIESDGVTTLNRRSQTLSKVL